MIGRWLQIAGPVAATLLALPAFAGDDIPPPPATKDVGIVEHLGDKLPLDAEFLDEHGNKVKLADSFKNGKPVVLSLIYFRCPMLCSLLLGGEAKVLHDMDLKLGQDYNAVTVSFDWKDTPATAKTKQENYLQALGQPGNSDSWHFLTTPDKAIIQRLTNAVGFNYFYDEKTDEFAHAAVIFVITPDGRISRYLYDISFQPKQMKLAVIEASAGTVGASIDRALLQCYRYDPATRKYGLNVRRFMQAGGLLTLLCLASLIGYLLKHDSSRKWAS